MPTIKAQTTHPALVLPKKENIHSFETFLNRYWIVFFAVLYGIFVGLPFLAPVLMVAGLNPAGQVIYFIYSFLCHQLPERSFFLFGQKFTYPLTQIQTVWRNTNDPAILRQFIGNTVMGWKVAWSDRMVSMYTSVWIFGLIWWFLRQNIKPLPWWGLVVFLLPMALDGTSHLISDFSGIGNGFRDSNLWLAILTHHVFPVSFYAGDAWGSFNSICRLLSGVFFGIGMVWFGFPYLNESFQSIQANTIRPNQ
ncbi:MAG TPA: DUF2085 domain-containing protein [Anaerolineaceae bacterium]|nr:DUF2085 domain-containing protein [Anaerolineaceae bacterium]